MLLISGDIDDEKIKHMYQYISGKYKLRLDSISVAGARQERESSSDTTTY